MNNQNDKKNGFLKSAVSLKITVSLLALCLIGGLMLYAVTKAVENTSSTVSEVSYEDTDGSYPPDTSVSAEIPITDSLENPDTSDTADDEAGDGSGHQESAGILPAEGEIIRPYSGDSLIYSETLEQYVCHKAIDIQAPAGSPVCAAAAGTVTETGKDDRYGSYVLIAHGNGLESRCCCLGDISVAEGDVVNKGDTIGSVGEDALFEKTDGPHIHFEVKKDGELTNPDIITG